MYLTRSLSVVDKTVNKQVTKHFGNKKSTEESSAVKISEERPLKIFATHRPQYTMQKIERKRYSY